MESRKAMEKIPADSGPWAIGVLNTCQVWPRSGEWKTRATFPPVANQMLGSGAKAASSSGWRGAEAPLFHGSAGGAADLSAAVAMLGRPRSLAALGTTSFGRIARQVLLAAKADSPSRAGGSCAGGIWVHVFPSSV